MIIVEIPPSWIRDIRKLTPTNVEGTVLDCLWTLFVLVMAVIEGTATTTSSADGTESQLVFIIDTYRQRHYQPLQMHGS
jgi:hypothetical protein